MSLKYNFFSFLARKEVEGTVERAFQPGFQRPAGRPQSYWEGTELASVTVKSLENMQQVVVTGDHTFIADEPEDAGGDDMGPSPYELLLASLAT